MTNNNNNAPTKGPSALITTGATEAVSFETTSGLGSGNAANVTAETLNLINENRNTRGLTEDVSFSDNISDTSEPETTNYHGCVCPSGYSPSSSIPTSGSTNSEMSTTLNASLPSENVSTTNITVAKNRTTVELNTLSTILNSLPNLTIKSTLTIPANVTIELNTISTLPENTTVEENTRSTLDNITTLPDNTAVEFNTSSTSKMTNVTINATKVSNTTTNGENTTVSELNTSSTLSTPTNVTNNTTAIKIMQH